MKQYFTDGQKERELNKIYLDDEDVLLIGEFVEKVEEEENYYVITGSAVIEGETYHEFEVEFELIEAPKEETLEQIMVIDWVGYSFLI